MISVITVTNRKGAYDYLLTQLDKQTFKDFEVIIADDYESGRTTNHFTPRPKLPADAWNLNKAYNDAVDRSRGELLVFLQDFIWVPANGLERFWELYQLFPNDLITAPGHKYRDGQVAEVDDRVYGERALVPSDWTYYELNWASCPKAVVPRFDEDMDTHYGGENQIFALKASLNGSKVWIDRTNECRGEVHGQRPADWEERHANKGFLNQKIEQYGRTTI